MGSQPLTLKCPGCMRGMYGKSRIVSGLAKTPVAPKLATVRGIQRWKALVHCLDCGHEWWTTHAGWADNHRAVGKCANGAAVRDSEKS